MRGVVNLLFVCAVVSMIGSLVHLNGKTPSEIQFSDECESMYSFASNQFSF